MMIRHILNFPTTLFCLTVLMLGASGSDAVWSQETMSEQALRARVTDVLPKWDRTLLEVPEGRDWQSDLDFATVYKILGVNPPAAEKIPEDARQLASETSIVRLDRARGGIRFIDRSRAWSIDKYRDAKLVSDEEARKRSMETAYKLGLPEEEMARVRVDTQVAAGAPVGAKQFEDQFEMYRIVTGHRDIGGLPVYGSRLRSAVNAEGELQRLMVDWPRFRTEPGLELTAREHVIELAVREISRQEPSPKAKLRAELAWAPVGDDEEILYVPAVVFSVLDPPTPYQFTVPVAEPKGYKGTDEKE